MHWPHLMHRSWSITCFFLGAPAMHGTGHCNVVALCDADIGAKPTGELLKLFPAAPRFQDFRRMPQVSLRVALVIHIVNEADHSP